MPRFFNNINLLGNQLQNALLDKANGAFDPSSPGVGQIWFNTAAGGDGQGRAKIQLSSRTVVLDDQYVGSVGAGTAVTIGGTALAPVVNVQAATGSIPGTMSATDYALLHTATNAATPSALVQRDSFGNAAFTQVSIANLPLSGTDGVNKNYADSIAAGFDPKASAALATSGPLPTTVYANGTAGVGATLTASAISTLTTTLIDGTSAYSVQVGDRILVKNEATTANNGIYTVTSLGSGASSWVLTRASDFNTATAGPSCISQGTFLFVENGANSVTQWMMNTSGAITVGITSIVFTQFGASSSFTNGNGLLLAGNTFSVNLTSTDTLEFNAGALRVKSSATANQVLLSGGTGVEPTYGALPLGNTSAVTGILGKAQGGLGIDASAGLTANFGLFAPNGVPGAASFRAMVASDLPSGVVAPGTYPKVTVDTYGRVTVGAALTASDIPSLDFSKISSGIVPTNQGGTGAATAVGALANLGGMGKATGMITGDGSTTSFVITHNLNSASAQAVVTDALTPWEQVFPNIQYNSVNQCTVIFTVAPPVSTNYIVRIGG